MSFAADAEKFALEVHGPNAYLSGKIPVDSPRGATQGVVSDSRAARQGILNAQPLAKAGHISSLSYVESATSGVALAGRIATTILWSDVAKMPTTGQIGPLIANSAAIEFWTRALSTTPPTWRKRQNNIKTLLSIIFKDGKDIRDAEMSEAIKEISDLLYDKNFATMDSIFSYANANQMSIEMIITILRSSFKARAYLKGYAAFLGSARTAIAARGRNADKLLKGLSV